MMKGTVSATKDTQYDGKTLYSFRLSGHDGYFNCGTYNPDVKKGELIEFDGTDKGGGKFQVNVPSVKVLKEAGTVVETPTRGNFRKTFQKDEGKDAYWKAREARDLDVQKTIQLQSARNSAIALADVIIKHGAVSLEKVAQAKKQGVIEGLVEELITKFQQDSANLTAPTPIAEPVEAVQEDGPNDEWA
jgi:hypothetical protein